MVTLLEVNKIIEKGKKADMPLILLLKLVIFFNNKSDLDKFVLFISKLVYLYFYRYKSSQVIWSTIFYLIKVKNNLNF